MLGNKRFANFSLIIITYNPITLYRSGLFLSPSVLGGLIYPIYYFTKHCGFAYILCS